MGTKQCSKCEEVKLLNKFYRRAASKDGRCSWCKQCMNEYGRQYRATHREETREYSREYNKQYYAEHCKEIRKRIAQWLTNNPNYTRQYRTDRHEEIKEYNRQYYTEHSEEIKERNAQWRANNPEYYIEHREEILERQHQYYAKNREKINERCRQYRKEHPREYNEEDRKRGAQWRANNPNYHHQYRIDNADKYRAHTANRHARSMAAEGTFTDEQFTELCKQYDNRCLRCREVKKLAADHIVPLSKGGSNYIDNIQPLCKSCNSKKGTRTIDYRTNPIRNPLRPIQPPLPGLVLETQAAPESI